MQIKFAFLAVAFILSGCSAIDWGIRKDLPVDENAWHNRYHAKRLKENVFGMEVISFMDERIPREKVPDTREDVIYEYDPERLLSGVNYRLPVLFDKHFDVSKGIDPIYMVELRLRKLRTVIRTGDLYAGPKGKYDVVLGLEAIVRRPDSSILYQDDASVHLDRSRHTAKGRDPSAELDRERMYDLTEAAVQKVAQRVTWKVRQLHRAEVRAIKRALEEKKEADFGVKEVKEPYGDVN